MWSGYWVVRTSGNPSIDAAALRDRLYSLDSRLIVTNIQPMTLLVEKAQASTRYSLFLRGVFAAIPSPLPAAGCTELLVSSVRQRSAEIGPALAA
jgi:hypothetical protein